MLLEPIAAPVAKPLVLTLTVAGLELLHVAVLLRFCVLPSLKVPVAVNCTLVPLAIEELFALMVIDCNVAAVTVSAKLFELIPFWAAVILLEPIAVPVAIPAAVILTFAGVDELHVTEFVRSCVVLSVNVPIAVN